MSEEEKAYLQNYNIAAYDRLSIATDIAVFSVMGETGESGKKLVRNTGNYWKMPEQKLKIIMN